MGTEKNLHIVSFNVPYPANYGGVIDVFHKIRWLHQLGIKVHLHCFHYGLPQAKELEKYCASIHYYPRIGVFVGNISYLPYIVKSRNSPALILRLLQDNYPILFEGLHTCYYLADDRLADRQKIYRESNIEHQYYQSLAKNTKFGIKKLFFKIEALRLYYFQKTLKHASVICTVSEKDKTYLLQNLKQTLVVNVPSFQTYDTVQSIEGIGNYILFHGNISVAENLAAAQYLLDVVKPQSTMHFIIAGLQPPKQFISYCKKIANVTLVNSPTEAHMHQLLTNAHISLLYTHQTTGLKLKLLQTIYSARHIIVNQNMLHGTEQLAPFCHVANTPLQFANFISQLINTPFTTASINERKDWLQKFYSNELHAKQLLQLIQF